MRVLSILTVLGMAATIQAAELKPETVAAWERYVELTEKRIERELGSSGGFLVEDFLPEEEREAATRARHEGQIFTTKLRTVDERGDEIDVPDGMIHHWMGSAFVPGVSVEELVAWLQAYDQHARYFDDVEESRLISRDNESFEIFLRLRRQKVVTVHYNTEHRVRYRRHANGSVSSKSRTTRIAEVEDSDTPEERELPVGEDRGFLWRLNSYWRFTPASGGVVVECESVSLSRGVPAAVRWLVSRYLDSVPRESLEATLGPIRAGGATLKAEGLPSCSFGASSRRCDNPPVRRKAEDGVK
jgi:hypothetical protein